VKDGKFQGSIYPEDLKSGNIYLALNPAFESKLPADVLAKIKKAEADIKSGKLELVPKTDATTKDS
jgi:basic membrane lipoprotein Med (substrate-binding protein (PBP1-ABC) superfamily)